MSSDAQVEGLDALAEKVDAEGENFGTNEGGAPPAKLEAKADELGDLDEVELEKAEETTPEPEFDPEKVVTKGWTVPAKEAFAKLHKADKAKAALIAELQKKQGELPENVTKELTELRQIRSAVNIQADPEFVKTYTQPIIDQNVEIVSTLTSLGVTDAEAKQTLGMTPTDRLKFLKEKGADGYVLPMFAKRDRLGQVRAAAIQKADAERPKLEERRKAGEAQAIREALRGVHEEVAKDVSVLRLTGGKNEKWDQRVAQRLAEAEKLALSTDVRDRVKLAVQAVALQDALRIAQKYKTEYEKTGKKLTRKIEGRPSLGGEGGQGKGKKETDLDRLKKMDIMDVAGAVGDGALD